MVTIMGAHRRAIAAAMGVCMLGGAMEVSAGPVQYPADYAQLVEASKAEHGVVVYSVIASSNWTGALKGFQEKYPWIKVETLDLSNELWDRYYTERSTGARTADMIVAFGVDRWLEFLGKGEAAAYDSPEAAALPEWVRPRPGLFSLSVDPVLLIWNKAALGGDGFDSMRLLARAAAEQGSAWKGRLGTYDAGAGSLTATFTAGWAETQGDSAWPILDALGPMTKVERSGGTITEKTLNGEYVVSYMVGGAAFYPRLLRDPVIDRVMGWSFMTDGQLMFPRGVAITAGARSPASARLLLDYALSREGQIAFGQGGLTPVRDDIAAGEIPIPTVTEIKAIVGEEDFHVLGYETGFVENLGPFVGRWLQAFGR